MKKLKNKVFYVTFSILTISILSFIILFNTQTYMEHKKSVENSLNVATDNAKKQDDRKYPNGIKPDDKTPPQNDDINKKEEPNIKFMDSVIYTVLIDENNNIKEIINHSNNNKNTEEINSIAEEILNTQDRQGKYIGSLYSENYSYSYVKGKFLIILDNSNIKTNLLTSLRLSVCIFFLLESLILLITKWITSWIIKPVEESFNKQKQFIADASHELKTPLSVIIASSEAYEANPKEEKWLKNIKEEAKRMNILVTDLLELASTENKENMKLSEGDLSKTVELSLLTFEGKAFESNIKLKYNIDKDIKFKMNENSIKELVEILLDNAIKHSKKNSTVTLNLTNSTNQIILEVQNKGEPIPKGEEKKIFERFYRVDKSRNRNENRYGLGLAIAKNIVESHGGTITASSMEDITTFKVLFKK
mgnify:CR=1 FL=1